MSRLLDGEGTIRYSTGRPGRENAPAVAEPPARLTNPGSATAAIAATNTRRGRGTQRHPNEFDHRNQPAFVPTPIRRSMWSCLW
jgi:hypothetical protein